MRLIGELHLIGIPLKDSGSNKYISLVQMLIMNQSMESIDNIILNLKIGVYFLEIFGPYVFNTFSYQQRTI